MLFYHTRLFEHSVYIFFCLGFISSFNQLTQFRKLTNSRNKTICFRNIHYWPIGESFPWPAQSIEPYWYRFCCVLWANQGPGHKGEVSKNLDASSLMLNFKHIQMSAIFLTGIKSETVQGAMSSLGYIEYWCCHCLWSTLIPATLLLAAPAEASEVASLISQYSPITLAIQPMYHCSCYSSSKPGP